MNRKEKMVFFVINAKFDLREFVIFPNGVLDRLARVSGLSIVLLVPEGKLKEKHHIFAKYKLHSNVTVLPFVPVAPKGILQKSFIFFVKYLIFTDTMRILATEGVRTDVPPAGGLRSLYFLKRTIHALFGHSRWIKKVLVPKLFDIFFPSRHYKNLFETHEPDAVFITDIKPFFSLLFLSEARRRGIRTIQTPGNWDHFKYYLPLQSDVMLASNRPLKKEAMAYHGYAPEQVHVTGFPRFDFYVKKSNFFPRAEFLSRYGFSPDTKLILFVSEGVYSLDGGDIVDRIVKWVEDGLLDRNTRVLLRPYPPYPGVHGEREKYRKFENSPLVAFETTLGSGSVENMKHFINFLYHSDVVINTYSTVAIESLVFNRPVINIGFDGYHRRPMHQSVKRFVHLSHFQHVTETPGVRTVTSEEELLAGLKNYLSNPVYNQAERDITRDRMCYKLDGKASERVVSHLLEALDS